MFKPERFDSEDWQDFKEGYDAHPVLNVVVTTSWLGVLVFSICGALSLLSGYFSEGLGLVVLAAISFLLWGILHNWVLTHPRSDGNEPSMSPTYLSHRSDLVRELLGNRLLSERSAYSAYGISPSEADEVPEDMLWGLPECTIVTIVETYLVKKRQGADEQQILHSIESHRAAVSGQAGEMPVPLDLQNYVRYRVHLEHGQSWVPLTDQFVDAVVAEALARLPLLLWGAARSARPGRGWPEDDVPF